MANSDEAEWFDPEEYLDLCEALVKSTRGKSNPFRIFSLKELRKATNNFTDLILNNSYYRIYKGTIEDRDVVVKRCGVNEVVSLSLIKHRNVVKLLGCCLETRDNVLVHEFPPNGTLAKNIFHKIKLLGYKILRDTESRLDTRDLIVIHELPLNGTLGQNISKLLWSDRLKIATQIADAVAYLHLKLHITHGCLWNPDAIFLDEFHSAKLGAFQHSKIQNQAESSDDETDNRSLFRKRADKSSDDETDNRSLFRKRADIEDFGSILLRLLGIDLNEVDKCRDKVKIQNCLQLNVSEKEIPQIEAYIDLSWRCRDREDELSMEEVARELRRIRSMINDQPTTDGNE